ncbi:MAG: ATP-binding protein [Candidatus Hydrogenedentota bacterium]
MILDATIGRDNEIETLLRNTMQGHHTLLIGRNGIGKTHLLLDLQRKIKKTDTAIHYVRRPVPAKEIIDSIYSWLCITAGVSKPRKVGHATRIVELGHMIAEILALPQMSGKKVVLLLDEFDQLPVLAVPVIEVLAEKVAIIAAARNRHRHPRFNRLFWRFDEVIVNPLSPQHARDLAAHVIQTVPGVKPIDKGTKDFLLNQIATLSSGVPSAIVESADRLRGAERIDKSYIRELFVHRSGNSYFDAAPLILTFFAFLIIMRYINRGMYQFDMYAIFGALSGMMLLVRWFMMRTSRSN